MGDEDSRKPPVSIHDSVEFREEKNRAVKHPLVSERPPEYEWAPGPTNSDPLETPEIALLLDLDHLTMR